MRFAMSAMPAHFECFFPLTPTEKTNSFGRTGTGLITWIHLDIGESLVQINGFLRPFVELIF